MHIIFFLGKNSFMEKNFWIKNGIIGFVAGIISGLFTSGGGLILVPAFSRISKKDEKISRGTSIFCVLFLVVVSSAIYFKGDYLDWNIGIKCAIGGIIGGAIGSLILKKINEIFLKISFILFLVYMSIKMLLI